MSVCGFVSVYPSRKALAVGTGSFEIDVGVLADLIERLGLTRDALQIHHGNMAALYQHLTI